MDEDAPELLCEKKWNHSRPGVESQSPSVDFWTGLKKRYEAVLPRWPWLAFISADISNPLNCLLLPTMSRRQETELSLHLISCRGSEQKSILLEAAWRLFGILLSHYVHDVKNQELFSHFSAVNHQKIAEFPRSFAHCLLLDQAGMLKDWIASSYAILSDSGRVRITVRLISLGVGWMPGIGQPGGCFEMTDYQHDWMWYAQEADMMSEVCASTKDKFYNETMIHIICETWR